MPIPCFWMHMIHLWYCQVPKYSNTWCIFRKYEPLYYAIPLIFPVNWWCFLLSELKSWWMTATQGSLSTGDNASSVRRVTPVKGQLVVMNPRIESYQKILDVVAERDSVSLHNAQYVAIQRCLNGCTKEMLADKEVTWRRSCYSYATNQTELQRVRGCFEHSVATGQYSYEKARP